MKDYRCPKCGYKFTEPRAEKKSHSNYTFICVSCETRVIQKNKTPCPQCSNCNGKMSVVSTGGYDSISCPKCHTDVDVNPRQDVSLN